MQALLGRHVLEQGVDYLRIRHSVSGVLKLTTLPGCD